MKYWSVEIQLHCRAERLGLSLQSSWNSQKSSYIAGLNGSGFLYNPTGTASFRRARRETAYPFRGSELRDTISLVETQDENEHMEGWN